MDNLYERLNDGKHTISVFVDFSKDFDTVKHDILLSKMEMCGVRGIVNDWFKSYLSGRSQCVKIGSSVSELSVVLHGVPQGSVLVPLLYLLYVNEIPAICPDLKVSLFADDTTLTATHKNIDPLIGNVNLALGQFCKWAYSNRICLNARKTNLMLFSNRVNSSDIESDIVVDGVNVQFNVSTKFSGLEIDSKITFNYHISNIGDKLSKVVGIMYRLSRYLPQRSLIKLYNSLFFPHLLYK